MGKKRLVYVMGPSGAGKDSLLDFLRRNRTQGEPFLVAHRYITRPPDAGGENHVAMSEEEFDLLRERNCLALDWVSHGNSYGLGREIDLWMGAGITVVMNGSRGYFAKALSRYPDMLPVLIHVAQDVLVERLVRRGRESEEEIRQRLARSSDFSIDHPRLVTIDNSGELQDAGTALHAVVRDAGVS